MHPVREEDDDILERLESRLNAVSRLVVSLKERNAELETRLRDAEHARDRALADAEQGREQSARLVEEADGLRARQKQAAARIRNLLGQIEQLDLLGEN